MANNIPSVDDIIQQRDKQIMQQLQQRHSQVAGDIKQRSEDEKRSIRSRHAFAVANLKRQYDAEKDPGRKQTILNQKKTLEFQSMSKLTDIDNKYLPENRELETAMKIEMQKIQQANTKRNFRLQTIRQLTQAGVITNPYLAQQAEYKALGIDIPLSALQPQESAQRQKAQMVTDIRNLDATLERYTQARIVKWGRDVKPSYLDPTTGETRKLNQKDAEDKAIIDQMDSLIQARKELRAKYQQTLLNENPAYRTAIEAQQDFSAASKTMTGKSIQGGGLKEMGIIAKGKPKQPTIDMSSLSDEELRAIVGGK